MPKSRQKKLKKQRKIQRDKFKDVHKSAEVAVYNSFAIAMYSAKAVFKERASNPKMEEFICSMLKVWDLIADEKVSVQTIVDSIEAESGIKYDIENGEILNLRRKC